MKKRRALSVILAGAMVFGAAVSALAAADSSAKQADVKFTAGGGGNPLVMDGGAADLKFGTRTVEMTDRYYPLSPEVATKISVIDQRGSEAGWNLQVTLSEFQATKLGGGTATLGGAKITFRPEVSAGDGLGKITHTTSDGSGPATWGAGPLDLVASASLTPIRLVEAAAGSGTNQTEIEWPAPSSDAENISPTASIPIELHVVGGSALALEYTATLTWSLYDTP